ncbi:GNAT family N-acetyltransferase [Devosia sp. ZB163]|uniref:GNAT family N-acetyltransferase n=1 Tax=Devosia sp. ZB163 TaxID=3025938 RepID=UPI00235E0E26|nr:GNAT family N-acetyltransferase [Devosia sp. ZB163]MDC9826094.1 GNAT family N-acetyltransferase [Devosia sp. ZB163]
MPDSPLSASIVGSIAEIPAEVWNGLAPSHDGVVDNPFLDHAFLLALEQSGSASNRTGWQPQHLVLSNASDDILGVMPLYLKSHSQGEYVFDHGWADAFQRAGGDYYPKLQCSVPFTPVTGPRFLARDEPSRTALLRTAEMLATRNNVSSIHATFVTEADAELARSSGWLVRHDTQYHWHNNGFATFEEFLETLSSRHRKVTRRERRDALTAEGLTVKWLTGSDLTEAVWDQFFEFYQDTGSRKWGRPYLNRRFFSLLSAAMANRVLLMFAYDGDEPIAGTFSLIGHDRLYGRYWGATRNVPFLHFELCYYQAIDYAIAHKLAVAEAGAQGEHKLARGYEPTLTRSVHWIGHPGLRDAIARFVAQERTSVAREQEQLERYTPFRHGERQ